jgi:hypothetical protein
VELWPFFEKSIAPQLSISGGGIYHPGGEPLQKKNMPDTWLAGWTIESSR